MEKHNGCSLLKRALKRWIYDNDFTQPDIARVMNISTKELKRKLAEHEKFNQKQLGNLVHFMGAKEAFKVIYFPSIEERQRVFYETFGNYKE